MKRQQPLTVMIVEDEPDLREVMVEACQGEGWQVFSTDSGWSALEQFMTSQLKRISIDVVVTDWQMQNGDGVWLAENISRLFAGLEPGPAMILFTGNEIEARETLGASLALFSGVLPKPIAMPQVLATIKRSLGDLPIK